jgi:hypothetical protein
MSGQPNSHGYVLCLVLLRHEKLLELNALLLEGIGWWVLLVASLNALPDISSASVLAQMPCRDDPLVVLLHGTCGDPFMMFSLIYNVAVLQQRWTVPQDSLKQISPGNQNIIQGQLKDQ